MTEYKPAGYTDLSPYLIVANAQAALDFMAAVFDAPSLRTHHNPDGSIMHTEARIGDTVVMVGQMAGVPGMHLHVYVADPAATMERALAAGGTLVEAVTRRDDGDLRGGVTAPDGTTWWIARDGHPAQG